MFALYVTLYNVYRVPLETLKMDTADIFFGQRVNVWVSGVLFVIGLVAFVMLFRRRKPAPPRTAAVAPAAPVSAATRPRRGRKRRSPPASERSGARRAEG